jgi:hypothetical protein
MGKAIAQQTRLHHREGGHNFMESSQKQEIEGLKILPFINSYEQ